MIERTVEALTPIIGASEARLPRCGRVCGDDLPSPPATAAQAGPAAARTNDERIRHARDRVRRRG